MDVLVAVSTYGRTSGFPRDAAQLAVGLHRRGHAVTVLTREAERTPADDGIRFEHYECADATTVLTLAHEPWKLARILRDRASDFDRILAVGLPVSAPVVLFGTGTHRGYVDTTLSTLSPRSWRWWFERVRPFHRPVLFWERRQLKGQHPRLVIVPDERMRAEYVDGFGLPPERVAVVPLAVELDEFRFDSATRACERQRLDLDDRTTLMLHAGACGRQKGLDVLVEALEQLERLDPSAPWVQAFVGAGSTSAELERRTAGLRARGRVRLLGRVPSVADLYSAADMVVFPSRYDPWGLVVTEALASGLPVVASSRAGSSQAVRPGENGEILVEPTDVAELVTHIGKVQRRSWDRDAIRATVESYSVDVRAQRVEAQLEQLEPSI